MKTKIIFLAILNILIWNGVATAQTKYYQTPGIINGEGFTYRCDIELPPVVRLYNSNNKLPGTEWSYRDGTRASNGILFGTVKTLEPDNNGLKMIAIMDNALTAEEKALFKNMQSGVTIELYTDSSTGKVLEVVFQLSRVSAAAAIPPERFFKVEQELKKSITVTPTAAGRQLKCVFTSVWYTPK